MWCYLLKNYGVWLGICILLFSIILFIGSLDYQLYGQYGPGPGLYPALLSGVLILISMLYIIDCLRKGNKITFSSVFPKGKVLARLSTIVASIIIFIFIAPFVGYIVSGVIVMLMLLLPDFKWYTSIGVSFTVTMILFVVFDTILGIPLPANIWGW